MKIGIVVGAAPLGKEIILLKKLIDQNVDKYVIAADGGIDFFVREKIKPDKWIGDMDSTKVKIEKAMSIFPELSVETCSPIKDETDMAIGLNLLFENGCDKAYIFGGTGGNRIDHSLANIALLYEYARNDKDVVLVSENSVLSVIYSADSDDEDTTKTITITRNTNNIKEGVSIFSLSDRTKYVSIKGLFYEYEGELVNYRALGVSNEFLKDSASICVRAGAILLVQENS